MILFMMAIATGFLVHSVQAEPRNEAMTATTPVAMANLATAFHDVCLVDQKGNTHGICFASCDGAGALAPSAVIFYYIVAQGILRPSLDLATSDHTDPPDPYPPKQLLLG